MDLVKGAITSHLRGDGEGVMRMVGGMNVLWCEGVRSMLGTEEHESCDVWLGPELGEVGKGHMNEMDGKGDLEIKVEDGRVKKEGLTVDIGRRHDCEIVSSYHPTSFVESETTPCRFKKREISKPH